MATRVDVIAAAGVRAIDANEVDGILVHVDGVDAVPIGPTRPEGEVDGALHCRSILDLDAPELTVAIGHEIERLVLRERHEYAVALLDQIHLRVEHAQIALVLRVMPPHTGPTRTLLRRSDAVGVRGFEPPTSWTQTKRAT